MGRGCRRLASRPCPILGSRGGEGAIRDRVVPLRTEPARGKGHRSCPAGPQLAGSLAAVGVIGIGHYSVPVIGFLYIYIYIYAVSL